MSVKIIGVDSETSESFELTSPDESEMTADGIINVFVSNNAKLDISGCTYKMDHMSAINTHSVAFTITMTVKKELIQCPPYDVVLTGIAYFT